MSVFSQLWSVCHHSTPYSPHRPRSVLFLPKFILVFIGLTVRVCSICAKVRLNTWQSNAAKESNCSPCMCVSNCRQILRIKPISSQYPIPWKDKINFATTGEACWVQYESLYACLHNVDPERQAMSSLEWLLWCFCKVPTVAVPCVYLAGPVSQIEPLLSKWWESGWRAQYECKQESDQKSHLIPAASFSPVLRTLAAFPPGRSHQRTCQEKSVWYALFDPFCTKRPIFASFFHALWIVLSTESWRIAASWGGDNSLSSIVLIQLSPR